MFYRSMSAVCPVPWRCCAIVASATGWSRFAFAHLDLWTCFANDRPSGDQYPPAIVADCLASGLPGQRFGKKQRTGLSTNETGRKLTSPPESSSAMPFRLTSTDMTIL